MIKYNNKRLLKIEFIYIIITVLYFIIPEAQHTIPFYINIVFMVTYSLYCIFNNKVNTTILLKFTVLIVCLTLMYTYLNDAASITSDVSNYRLKRFLSKFFQLTCMFYPILLFKRVSCSASRSQCLVLLIVAVIVMIFACKPILDLIEVNPEAARKFGYEEDMKDFADFIAPYPFVYGMTYAFVCCTYLYYNISKQFVKEKYIVGALALFFLYFLFKSQFTLSLITSIITLAIIYSKNIKTTDKKILFFVGLSIFLLFLPSVISLFVSMLPDTLANRMTEISDFWQGDVDKESDLMGRFDLYGKSIIAFLNSPIVGNRSLPFDGHATYLMVWADLGIFGGCILFKLLFMAKKVVQNELGGYGILFGPFFIHLLLNGFTNPIHASLQMDICMWLLVPISLMVFVPHFKNNR